MEELILDGKKFDLGVVIGRFQVPYLHDGHKRLISTVRALHAKYLIFVGVSATLGTTKDPLDYVTRMKMIQDEFPDAIILPIKDEPSDESWSKHLDLAIRDVFPLGTVRLYAGRDSFIPSYSGKFPTFEFPDLNDIDGTAIRELISKKTILTKEGREGWIHAIYNQYDRVYPTIDVAIVEKEGKQKSVILGKKPGFKGLVFIGGFVGTEDVSLEEAALREAMEETGSAVEPGTLTYVGSFRIDNDWRYKGRKEKIMTSLFRVPYLYGSTYAKGTEEFEHFQMYPLNKETYFLVDPIHRDLFKALLKFEKVKLTITPEEEAGNYIYQEASEESEDYTEEENEDNE